MMHQYFQNFRSINSIGNGAANECTKGSLTLEVSYRTNEQKTRDKRGKYDVFIEFCKRFEANYSVFDRDRAVNSIGDGGANPQTTMGSRTVEK